MHCSRRPVYTSRIDFGASSLIALNQLGIGHNSIDAILLSHLHGDHCAGVPFMLLDAMLGAKRQAPLTIAGPRGTKARLAAVADALFPGMRAMKPKFVVRYLEMKLTEPNPVIDGVVATPYPSVHTPGTNPTSLRVKVEGKTISYTGDSAWTPHMAALAKDADLLVAECYFHSKSVRFHMNYPEIEEHWEELAPGRTVLTHMSPEMLAHVDAVPQETAYDGLVVDL